MKLLNCPLVFLSLTFKYTNSIFKHVNVEGDCESLLQSNQQGTELLTQGRVGCDFEVYSTMTGEPGKNQARVRD